MGRCRVALCQLDAVVGDLEGNAGRVISMLAEAEAAGADLAVFPELVLTGYPPEDLLLEPGFVAANLRALDKVAAASQRCAAVIGYVEEAGDLYNAAAVCAGGEVRGRWRKQILPNYGVFDERRWFAPGGDPDQVFLIGGVRVGITICEDVWSPSGPVARLGQGGAELVVTLNASPYRAGVLAERERMLATRAADASCALAYVNLVGGQDELVFDGASMVVRPRRDPGGGGAAVHRGPRPRRPRAAARVPQAPARSEGPRGDPAAAGRCDLRQRRRSLGRPGRARSSPRGSAAWKRSTGRSCSGRRTTWRRTASPTP